MKRFLSLGFFGLGVVLVAGCPIYPDQVDDYRVCNGQRCYRCPDDTYSSACTNWGCDTTSDCPSGYACASNGACVYGNPPPTVDAGTPGTHCTRPSDCASGLTCGSDSTCHSADCTSSGCASGYVCKLRNGEAECVLPTSPPDAGKDTSTPDATFNGCHSDVECPTPAGSRCLDGACVAPSDQCFDGTQCTGGAQCVQGACTPACSETKACPTGYACDTGKGVCTANPSPCGTDPNAAACDPGTVCAQNHCVTPCGVGNTCAAGLICVEGGCVPNQKPQFTCNTEGQQSECASGSICLHHSCYIGCNPDAGTEACKAADKFNECKSVQTSTSTYAVCGSSTNLGTDCDPTQGKACADAKICIDGFCR